MIDDFVYTKNQEKIQKIIDENSDDINKVLSMVALQKANKKQEASLKETEAATFYDDINKSIARDKKSALNNSDIMSK